jgi:hypothetical protein
MASWKPRAPPYSIESISFQRVSVGLLEAAVVQRTPSKSSLLILISLSLPVLSSMRSCWALRPALPTTSQHKQKRAAATARPTR